MDPQQAAEMANTGAQALSGPWGIFGSFLLIFGSVGALWRRFQRERVDTANDRAQVDFLAVAIRERNEAVKRSDYLSDQLNLAIREIGPMRGQLDFLTEKADTQSKQLAQQSEQLAQQSEHIRKQSKEIAGLRHQLESRK